MEIIGLVFIVAVVACFVALVAAEIRNRPNRQFRTNACCSATTDTCCQPTGAHKHPH